VINLTAAVLEAASSSFGKGKEVLVVGVVVALFCTIFVAIGTRTSADPVRLKTLRVGIFVFAGVAVVGLGMMI
jgi:hypothetical protein